MGSGHKHIGIAIDSWKMATFTEVLTEAGYQYAVYPLSDVEGLFIKVFTSDRKALHPIVERANQKCNEQQKKKKKKD